MFQKKKTLEALKTLFIFSNFFFAENYASVDNSRTRFAYWITKATDTHSEYVILLFHGQKMVTRTCHSIAFIVRCLSFKIITPSTSRSSKSSVPSMLYFVLIDLFIHKYWRSSALNRFSVLMLLNPPLEKVK
jgi:hypothetical protein